MTELSPIVAAKSIQARAAGFKPRVGLVLGSGLGPIAAGIADANTIPYAEIAGFPVTTVSGHAGRLVLGRLGGVAVACLEGRVHLYEGRPFVAIKTFVRTLKLIGCETVLLTNAAGAVRRGMPPGSLMMVTDHINFLPGNPLIGPNDDEFGPRFPAMNEVYDPALRALLRRAASRLGIALHEGVYLGCLGPSLETPAEIRAFASLGADAVGMSTVPEAIVARHCALRVAAISVITNLAAGLAESEHSHDQTLEYAGRAVADLSRLIAAFLEILPNDRPD